MSDDHADNLRRWAQVSNGPNRQRILEQLEAAAAYIEELEATVAYQNETLLMQNQRINELRDQAAAWREYCKAKDGLLASYRVGSLPSERVMRRLTKAREAVELLESDTP